LDNSLINVILPYNGAMNIYPFGMSAFKEAYSAFVSNESIAKLARESGWFLNESKDFRDAVSIFSGTIGTLGGVVTPLGTSLLQIGKEIAATDEIQRIGDVALTLGKFGKSDAVRTQLEMIGALVSVRHPEFAASLPEDTGLLSAYRLLDELGRHGSVKNVQAYLDERLLNSPTIGVADNQAVYQTEVQALPLTVQDQKVRESYCVDAATSASKDDLAAVLELILNAIQSAPESIRSKLIWLVLLPFLFNVMTWVVGPMADFYIKRHLDEPRPGAAAEVRQVATAVVGNSELLANHRFVKSKRVNLLESANARAKPIGHLSFGDVVRVVEDRGAFTLVSWSAADGTAAMQGWVFTRYLKRFS
jgi:hypothetical protein